MSRIQNFAKMALRVKSPMEILKSWQVCTVLWFYYRNILAVCLYQYFDFITGIYWLFFLYQYFEYFGTTKGTYWPFVYINTYGTLILLQEHTGSLWGLYSVDWSSSRLFYRRQKAEVWRRLRLSSRGQCVQGVPKSGQKLIQLSLKILREDSTRDRCVQGVPKIWLTPMRVLLKILRENSKETLRLRILC
jgi:hypothetical protein